MSSQLKKFQKSHRDPTNGHRRRNGVRLTPRSAKRRRQPLRTREKNGARLTPRSANRERIATRTNV